MIWDTEVRMFPPRAGTGAANSLGNRRPGWHPEVRGLGTTDHETIEATTAIRPMAPAAMDSPAVTPPKGRRVTSTVTRTGSSPTAAAEPSRARAAAVTAARRDTRSTTTVTTDPA